MCIAFHAAHLHKCNCIERHICNTLPQPRNKSCRHAMRCAGCKDGEALGFDFVMAFQPIVDMAARRVWGYEALVRGTNGEGAGWVLAQVTDRQPLSLRPGLPRQGDHRRRRTVPRAAPAAVDQLHAERGVRAVGLHPHLAGGGREGRLRARAHQFRIHRRRATRRQAHEPHHRRIQTARLPRRARRLRLRL